MLRGIYTSAAGMITEGRKHDAITNNISNLNTPGYKAQEPVARAFPEVLISLLNGDADNPKVAIGHLNTGVMLEENVPLFLQGDLTETGEAGDVAIISNIQVFEDRDGEQVPLAFNENGIAVNQDGETVVQPQAFFTVQNASGETRYTRNGQLQVDAEGFLRNGDGFYVVGRDGEPLQLELPMERIRVGDNGLFYEAATGAPLIDPLGDPIGLQLTQINNPYALVREGNGVFRLHDPEANPPLVLEDDAQGRQSAQYHIERSNVDPAKSMVQLSTALKAYEANQKMIQYLDRTLDKAVNEIGRVQG